MKVGNLALTLSNLQRRVRDKKMALVSVENATMSRAKTTMRVV